MHTLFHKIVLTLVITLAAIGISRAEDFAGTYHVKTNGQIIKVQKMDGDKYSITTDDWVCVAFWDKQAKAYEGVFRYNDTPKFADKEYSKGGKFENAVGYHLFEPTATGFKVTFHWGLSPEQGGGTYEIERVKQ